MRIRNALSLFTRSPRAALVAAMALALPLTNDAPAHAADTLPAASQAQIATQMLQAQLQTVQLLTQLVQTNYAIAQQLQKQQAGGGYDPMNFCYYEDKPYSRGAQLRNMTCSSGGGTNQPSEWR